MKKLLLMAALGAAGIVSAKSNIKSSTLDESHEIAITKNDAHESEFSMALFRYGYLYQSSCGTYFTMTSDILISDMTDSQYEQYWDSVVSANDELCSNQGPKDYEYFVSNDKK